MDRFKQPTAKEQNDYPLCEVCEIRTGFYNGVDKLICDKCETEAQAEKRERISEGMER